MLRYVLTHYHLTLKRVLEAALADPDLQAKVTIIDKKGRPRVSRYAISRVLYAIAPKGWALAPVRDYLINDATAMLLSHFSKAEKGEHESNPPTLHSLTPLTEEERQEAYRQFAQTEEFPLKPQQAERIDEAEQSGKRQVAARLSRIYQSWAASRAAGQLLRKMEAPLPRPLEFTRPEFGRGFLLARKGNNYYLLVRLFAKGHRYWGQATLDDGFIDWRTKELIAGRKYPGLILPLELGREHHELEYLEHGRPQSAKLLVKRGDLGEEEFYVHIPFEFSPAPIETATFMGIDRGAVKIGAGTIIDGSGKVVAGGIALEGTAFAQEMARLRARIAEAQRRGIQRGRLFRLRGRRAEIAIGEYANRVVNLAAQHRAQIALERVDATSMARFLTQSQFRKLQSALAYKAERLGLPAPIEVPAAYTSQTCAKCGHKDPANRPKKDSSGRAIRDVFQCLSCGYKANADDNASEVIALRALHQTQKGGKFQKFEEFEGWLKSLSGRDGSLPTAACP